MSDVIPSPLAPIIWEVRVSRVIDHVVAQVRSFERYRLDSGRDVHYYHGKTGSVLLTRSIVAMVHQNTIEP